MDIAKRVNRVTEGRKLVVSLQKRIDSIRMRDELRKFSGCDEIKKKNNNNSNKPKVLCLEWISPLFTAGHWVPQMVEFAGGINGLSYSGRPSRRINDFDEIRKFNPDKIILMPCGFNVERTLKEAKTLETNDKWKSLQSVQNNEVYAVNAGAYFSKPGPRTITGLEVIAKIIDPDSFEAIKVPTNSFSKYSYH
jgi:iron complex transport system substrate-binding protein